MSKVYVHGVTRAGEGRAVEGAGARPVVDGELAAIVTDAAGETRAADLMRRHWRVLETVAERATVVPVQFGTAMAGEDAVAGEFLAPRRESLETQLATFDGKVQLTLKGTYDEAVLLRSIIEGSPAVAQLRERVRGLSEAAGHFERVRLGELVSAEVEQARARDAEALHARLDGLAVATSREPASGLQAAVNSAFLVERGRADEFARAVDAAAEELGGRIELRLLGPLPPYSFVAEEAPAWA
ncbi:MAG TPA: GvpL/GvpF family gas vesicle protein [Solirubrobacteraceae bacterium]|nr:GvpL/GvpF family gas vesicle protein [Solirubrobacteraceae bacterium]